MWYSHTSSLFQLAYDGMKEDKNGDTPLLAQFYPKNSTTLPKCIARLALSGWNPPPPNRRLQGDLFYIDVTTLEGESFVVTASSRGFYINQSKNTVKFDPAPRGKTFTTLPALLSSVRLTSSNYRVNFFLTQFYLCFFINV